MTPEETVQAQVEAYNDRNIIQFAALHAEDIELYTFSEHKPYAIGRDKLKKIYQDVFENSPNLHAEITNRIVLGNTIIDHEKVTGRKGIEVLEIIAIYEVENSMIKKAHFVRG